MAELSRAEAYIAGPKGREYAAVALDRADSSAEPLAWEVGGRSPAYLPSHVAANAGLRPTLLPMGTVLIKAIIH